MRYAENLVYFGVLKPVKTVAQFFQIVQLASMNKNLVSKKAWESQSNHKWRIICHGSRTNFHKIKYHRIKY